METVEIEYLRSYTKSAFAEVRVMVDYTMTHKKNGYTNIYTVTCRIAGLQNHSPYLCVEDVILNSDDEEKTNPETLTELHATDLFEGTVG